MDNNKILVTGGTGFIGSGLVERLVKEKYKVVVLDNDFRGSQSRLTSIQKDIEMVEGDVRKKEDVKKAAENCDVIFHLAFINGTKFFYEKPDLVLDVGVKGALNTLEVAIENKIDKYVLASSSEVYQQPTHVPTTEEERIFLSDVRNPRYSYAGGKIISELLTINYLRDSSIKYHIFRPHNVFGPQMGFEHVIPDIMRKLYLATDKYSKDKCEIEIQGTGEETRAFCFIDDAVDEIITIFKNGETGEIYHIGMNDEITIKQLILDMCEAMNIKVTIKSGELQKGGTSRRCPSIDKVCSLGYKKVNHYEEGLKKTVDWYKNYYLQNGVE